MIVTSPEESDRQTQRYQLIESITSKWPQLPRLEYDEAVKKLDRQRLGVFYKELTSLINYIDNNKNSLVGENGQPYINKSGSCTYTFEWGLGNQLSLTVSKNISVYGHHAGKERPISAGWITFYPDGTIEVNNWAINMYEYGSNRGPARYETRVYVNLGAEAEKTALTIHNITIYGNGEPAQTDSSKYDMISNQKEDILTIKPARQTGKR